MPCYTADDTLRATATGPLTLYFEERNPGPGVPRNAYFFAPGPVSKTPTDDPITFSQQGTLAAGAVLPGCVSTGQGRWQEKVSEVLFTIYLTAEQVRSLVVDLGPCVEQPCG